MNTLLKEESQIRINDARDGVAQTSHLLPLKNDLIFKLVFGDARYIEIIRAFLISILDIPADEYEDLQIIDPHLERDRPDDKLGILDVRVQLKDKKIISVEIQIREIPFMAERVAFSTGRNLSRQILPGQSYAQIRKVVTIVITDYNMIAADGYYHHKFWLYDPEKRVGLTDIMEVHILEMKKLPATAANDPKENELLDWLRLIRSEREDEIEMLATRTPEMEMAVGRLKQLSADERTRMLYEARELAVMDEMARLDAARAEGHKEGHKEGRHENALETARKMSQRGTEPQIIAEDTGLTLEEVTSIQGMVHDSGNILR